MDEIETLRYFKDTAGIPIITGPRKIFVLGLTISALSIMEISKALLERRETPFEYILTYHFSQDQFEMYFSNIRSRFGWNNNPTVLELKYAFRQLLLTNRIDSPSQQIVLMLQIPITVVKKTKLDRRISEILLSKNVWRSDIFH